MLNSFTKDEEREKNTMWWNGVNKTIDLSITILLGDKRKQYPMVSSFLNEHGSMGIVSVRKDTSKAIEDLKCISNIFSINRS